MIDLDRLRPTLHRYCARMVGSALDGEDIVQEAMLRALEAALPDRPIENPEGWLFRIAHNLALDFLRRRARLGDDQAHVLGGDEVAAPYLERVDLQPPRGLRGSQILARGDRRNPKAP